VEQQPNTLANKGLTHSLRVYHHNAQQLQCHQGQGNPQKHTFMAPNDSCHYLP